IKLKDNLIKLFFKYKFVIYPVAIVGFLYFLIENHDLYSFIIAFKILTTYILPWGIFFCLIQIMRKIK
ncbi:hypothetical protein, partial [Peribacillus simplex]|uniref:hypothetical protein n=1 Tax=Peribacillus simplex TaxID=1478 RepID=UPI001A927572